MLVFILCNCSVVCVCGGRVYSGESVCITVVKVCSVIKEYSTMLNTSMSLAHTVFFIMALPN